MADESEEVKQSVVIEKYKEYMYKGQNNDFNNQVIYRFPNNYGASVIHGKGSYGLELLQIYFPKKDSEHFIHGSRQYYDLSKSELEEILTEIKDIK